MQAENNYDVIESENEKVYKDLEVMMTDFSKIEENQ